MSLELTQQEGLDKAYAHYLLFNKNSNVLVNVINSLGLDLNTYTPLLVRRNKEHINKALETFVIDGDYGNFDKIKYNELLRFSDATKLSDDEQTKHAKNINLIHNTVIKHYPASGATPDPNHDAILNDARENLNKGLPYYGGIDRSVPKPETPHQSMDEMNTAIKQATKPSEPLKHSFESSDVDLKPKHSSSVDLKLALEVVATASRNARHKVSGQITTVVSQPEKQATKPLNLNLATAIPVSTVVAFHEAGDKNIVYYTFITSENEHIEIPTMNYGATIRIDGNNMNNRCFLLALAHGLGLNEVVFYRKILQMFGNDDTDEEYHRIDDMLTADTKRTTQLLNDLRNTINQTFTDFLNGTNSGIIIKTEDGVLKDIGRKTDRIPDELKTEITRFYNDNVPDNFTAFLKEHKLYTSGDTISYDYNAIPQYQRDEYEVSLKFLRLKKDIITSGEFIDITEFFNLVFIQEVADRGLVCLILDYTGVIDINNPITLRGEVDKAKTKNPDMSQYEEAQLTKKITARFDIQNSSVVPIVGNLSPNSIVLINTNGSHFILGIMTEEMLNTINKVITEERDSGILGEKIINIDYDQNNKLITIDLTKLKGGGGFKKTKKRRGYNKRKTCRRKLSK